LPGPLIEESAGWAKKDKPLTPTLSPSDGAREEHGRFLIVAHVTDIPVLSSI
jgi:hypothetical protein